MQPGGSCGHEHRDAEHRDRLETVIEARGHEQDE